MSSRRNAKKASKKERRLSKAIRRGATDDMLAAGVGSLNVTNVEEDAEAMERFLDKIPPEKQREMVARQKEDDAYEKVATQDLMRAFDLARAYRYDEALPILSNVIERLHPETVDVSLERPNGGWMDCRYVSQVAIEALKARAQIHLERRDLQQAFDDASVLVRTGPILTAQGRHACLADFLELRVHILRLMGDYDGAIADARVWLDLGDNIEEDPTRPGPSKEESTRAALKQFQENSVIKLAETAVAETPRRRPYFADEAARRAFQRSAMIGPWARRELGCALCARKHTSAAPLMWCSRCNQVAYCCRAHQKQDWKAHKLKCNMYLERRNNPYAAVMGTRDKLAANLNDKGYDLLGHDTNPDVMLQDPVTGEFYELISNNKVLCTGEMSEARLAQLDRSGLPSGHPLGSGVVDSRASGLGTIVE